jgi:hypothetical protein
MKQAETADGAMASPVDSALMIRVFYGFAVMAILSVAISVGGKWFGKSIAMAGHTDDTTLREVVIGNDVLSVPANAIRFERARRDGIAERLDLYLHWPDMQGYSTEFRDDFDNVDGVRRILFLGFERRLMSRDMSGRFDPIYRSLVEEGGKRGPGGVTIHAFKPNTGYLNEVLAVAERPGKTPFVARCLSGPSADESLAPCERDLHVGRDMALTYRFPQELLGDWRRLDDAVTAAAARFVKTGG